MSAQAGDISVVICAYTEERWEQLKRAVASLQHQSITPREILVVIDHNPAIAALNPQVRPERLMVGQELRIPIGQLQLTQERKP
jgi:hypothetical protein